MDVNVKVNVVKKDPSDNKFIECAIAANADYLVSGDEHLLEIGRYQDTRIVSVREFLQILTLKR